MNSVLVSFLYLAAQVSGASFTIPDTLTVVTAPPAAKWGACFTVHSSSSGWAAIGIGGQMAGSDMYIGWKNSTNGFTVSNRPGVGTILPIHATEQQSSRVKLIDEEIPSWAKLSFSFCRKTAAVPAITANSVYIWGVGEEEPSTVDDPASPFAIHTKRGSFASDLTPTGQSTTGNAPPVPIIARSEELYETIVGVHGALLWFAWSVIPMIAIFVARYGKDRLGHTWYIIHMGLLGGITFLFTVASVILIILYRPAPHFGSATNPHIDLHAKMGLALAIAVFFQVVLGYLSNHFFDENRTSIPVLDRSHWYLGRILMIFGLVTTYFGFKAYESLYILNIGFLIFFYVLVGLGFLAFVYGEFAIGQKNHLNNSEKEDLEMHDRSERGK